MVNSLLQSALGRAETSDRDHYANKRLDLVGPLLSSLFRQNFKRMKKDATSYLQKKMVGRGVCFSLLVSGSSPPPPPFSPPSLPPAPAFSLPPSLSLPHPHPHPHPTRPHPTRRDPTRPQTRRTAGSRST